MADVIPLTGKRGVKAFAKWLTAAGAEVLPTKGEYEILRFRGGAALSLVHRSLRGRISFQGEAAECWEKYSTGQSHEFDRSEDLPPVLGSVGPDSGQIILDMAAEGSVTIAAIMERLRVTPRAASTFLHAATADGRLTRSGGGRGDAYRWDIVRSAA